MTMGKGLKLKHASMFAALLPVLTGAAVAWGLLYASATPLVAVGVGAAAGIVVSFGAASLVGDLALEVDAHIIAMSALLTTTMVKQREVIEELENVLAIPREEVILASAKEGRGIEEILEAIVARVPPPKGDPTKELQALVFDSHYDPYKGVIVYVRLAAGTLNDHHRIRLMASGAEAEILELGNLLKRRVEIQSLDRGDHARKKTNGQAQAPRRVEDVDPDPDVADGDGQVDGPAIAQCMQLPGRQHLFHETVNLAVCPSAGVVELDLAVLAIDDRMPPVMCKSEQPS